MSLRLALDVTRSSLAANAERAAVVSRNVANVNNADFSRKSANLVTMEFGGVRVETITRSTNEALFNALQKSSTEESYSSAVLTGLDNLRSIFGDTNEETSISSEIGRLRDGLQTYASNPGNSTLAALVVEGAQSVTQSLNEASSTIQSLRATTDQEIASSVDELRTLLVQFEELEGEITRGTVANTDITNQLDARDKLVSQISEIIGIRTIVRHDNSMVIFAANGATMFERHPREITYQPTNVFVAGTTGGQISIDGVALDPSDVGANGGRIGGLLRLRDDVTPTMQSQLDEIARGLIERFAESDQSAVPTLPDRAGLFTYPGGPGVPAAGTLVDGLAASIQVNDSVVPSLGGDPVRLRDGQISDPGNPAYLYNTTLGQAYSDRLIELADGVSQTMTFDAGVGIASDASLLQFSANSISWFEGLRSTESANVDHSAASVTRFQAALRSEIGVNLDAEMTTLLDLEKSYQATSRLVAVIDRLFDSLLQAVR